MRELSKHVKGPRIVFGRSLGGACAAEVAGLNPPIVDALVLESSGADLLKLIARRYLPVPAKLSTAEFEFFAPVPKLKRFRLPTPLVHGAGDQLINPSEAKENLAALGSTTKRLVLVPGRGHNDVSLEEVYWEALGALVDSLVGTPASGT